MGKLALLGGGLLLGLLLVELVARFYPIEPYSAVDRHGYRRYLDEGTQQGEIATFHETLGYTLLPDLRGVEFAGGHISTNSRGVRGRREYPLERTASRRIVALGDSFTFGECLADHESYPAVLEARLDDAEVINLGVFAYGLDQMLLKLRLEGLAYQPDLVLVGLFNDDMERNQHAFFCGVPKPRFVLEDGELALSDRPRGPEYYRHRPVAPYYLRQAWYAGFGQRKRAQDNHLVTTAILDAIVDETLAAGARVAFVYLPGKEDCLTGASNPVEPFLALATESSATYIDPTDRIHAFLQSEPKPEEHFACTDHYSRDLQALVAEVILDRLDLAGGG